MSSASSEIEVSTSEALPFLCLADPGWMLCKDGSVLCAFEYGGLDVDNIDEARVRAALDEMQNAIGSLDDRFYLWWVVDKRKNTKYPRSEFQSEAARVLDDCIAQQFADEENFSLVFRLYVQYTGETGVFAYMDNVRRLINEDNKSLIAAMVSSLNPSTLSNAAALHDISQLQSNIDTAEDAVRKFEGRLGQVKLRRLLNWEFENALIQCANITLESNTEYQPMPGTLMDGYAAMSDIQFGREVVSISGPNRSLLAANLSLNAYPPNATSRVLEVLMSLPAELRITHVVKCLGQQKAARMVAEITRYFQMTQTSFFQKALSKLTKTEPIPKPGRTELYQSCLEAQARTLENNLGWVQHALTVTVMESSLNVLEKRINEVLRTVNTASFIRERLGLKASFLSTIPGHWHTQKRLNLVNVELLADCTPMITIGSGQPKSQFLSEIYDKPMPAMSVFRTTLGTSFNFNPHVGQTGHALLVMPSGGGKTTFVNYCLTQFQRYPDAQVVIFDRDWSCRIITGLVGGTHIDIRDKPVRLNPMAAIKQGPDGMRWTREFLVRIIEDGGLKTTHDDRNTIDEKLRQLAESDSEVSLSRVAHVLPTHLHAALQEWLGEGPFGFFDSTEDDLQLSNWTCIEMKRFMSIDRMARAFMDHAFRVLSGRLGAKPTFIYIEEASFLLNNPIFLSALDDWLKTFRKLNAFVWLTMQSPESVSGIADERIRATLADNIPNLILGFNQRLENHRDLYKRMFALTDDQVNLIGALKAKRDYLLVTNDSDANCRVLSTRFTPEMLAYLRSEVPFQDLFTKALNSGRADWRKEYINQAISRG